MRILLVGATGTIGKAIVAALGRRHEVLLASRQQTPLHVDMADPASIRALYAKVGKVGAVISAAGEARFKPLEELSDADFAFSIDSKLMGQVTLVRYGLDPPWYKDQRGQPALGYRDPEGTRNAARRWLAGCNRSASLCSYC